MCARPIRGNIANRPTERTDMDYIMTDITDGVLVLTLDRPEARNAVHAAMRAEVREALAVVNDDGAIRAAVITGAGDKAFCAGNDLAETAAFDPDQAETWVADLRSFLSAIRDLDKPCVGAINGVAAGAGLQIALLCDLRIGHPGSRIGQPEINVGLASVIGVQLLGLALGHARTQDFALTGRLADADECLAIGLLTRIVPEGKVLEEAIAAANHLADRPTNAFLLTKRRLRQMSRAPFEDAFAAAVGLQRAAYRSGEPQEAMAKFFARKKAP